MVTAPDPGDRVLVEAEVVAAHYDAAWRWVRFLTGQGNFEVPREQVRPWHPPLPEGMTPERLRVIAGNVGDHDCDDCAESVGVLRGWADALDTEEETS